MAASSANAARLAGEESLGLEQDAVVDRWTQIQSQLSELTLLLSPQYENNYTPFYEELHRQSYMTYQRQLDYGRQVASWRAKTSSYRTAMGLVAVSLFLLGLSLNIHNWVRYLFAGCGVLLDITTIVMVILVMRIPVHVTPGAAMEHFVNGQILYNTAFAASGEKAEELYVAAQTAFQSAIELDENYADAYQWGGYSLLEKRLAGANAERNVRAAASMEKAIELGNDNSVVYTNLGWAYTLSENYGQAIQALQHAIFIEPTECLAYFNLGLAQLAAEKPERAKLTYEDAMACLLEESPDAKTEILTNTELDLFDLSKIAPDAPGVDEMLLRIKETAASLTLLGEPIPQDTSAQIDDIIFAGDIAQDGSFLDVGETFTAGTPTIYTILSFEDIPIGTPWLVRWYLDGAQYNEYIAKPWNNEANGQTWVRVQGAPMPAGDYQVEIYVSGNLIASADFTVQAGEVVEMEQYASSYYKLALNYPADWVVIEYPTIEGYLFASPPDDERYSFWYNTIPWEGTGSDSVLGELLSLWHSKHPDLVYGQKGEFILGGLAQASYFPVTYADVDENLLAALLIGMVDEGENAHMVVLQAPDETFDQTYASIFDPMLRSLKIHPQDH